MATATGATTKKKSEKTKTNRNGSELDFDKIRLRLFEPERDKKEYLLDKIIIKTIEDYEKYLEQKFGQKPASNKVVELLLEESLNNNADFQTWRKTASTGNGNGKGSHSEEEKDVLETS